MNLSNSSNLARSKIKIEQNTNEQFWGHVTPSDVWDLGLIAWLIQMELRAVIKKRDDKSHARSEWRYMAFLFCFEKKLIVEMCS